jgi:hypothetical protein
MYFTVGITDKNNQSEKSSSVIYDLFVSPSVINLPMNLDLQIDKVHQKKSTRSILLVNLTYYQQENRK